jgi:2-haloacid dehalogenase
VAVLPRPVVFDAYGTLFDLGGLATPLERRFPGRGTELAQAWRATQLRHTWLLSLMERWVDFDAVTREALAQTLHAAGLAGGPPTAEPGADGGDGSAVDDIAVEAMAAYRVLPAYPDVAPGLALLDPARPLAILTNGSRLTVETTVRSAGLTAAFPVVLSADDVRMYKPAASVYALATRHFGVVPGRVTFVSANAWDCAGAGVAGFHVVRLQRTPDVAERVGPPPGATITDLRDLAGVLGDAGPASP